MSTTQETIDLKLENLTTIQSLVSTEQARLVREGLSRSFAYFKACEGVGQKCIKPPVDGQALASWMNEQNWVIRRAKSDDGAAAKQPGKNGQAKDAPVVADKDGRHRDGHRDGRNAPVLTLTEIAPTKASDVFGSGNGAHSAIYVARMMRMFGHLEPSDMATPSEPYDTYEEARKCQRRLREVAVRMHWGRHYRSKVAIVNGKYVVFAQRLPVIE